MSQGNIPATQPAIEKFIRRVSSADKSNQKEIRMTIQEARDLVQDLALISSNLGKVVAQINNSLSEIQKSSTEVDIKFDGGGF